MSLDTAKVLRSLALSLIEGDVIEACVDTVNRLRREENESV